MTANNLKAVEEVADMIAASDPARVLAFRPSERSRERVSELIRTEKTEGLSLDEKSELDYYMHIEHLMRMAKIYARKYTTTR